MDGDLEIELEKLTRCAKERGAAAAPIRACDIVVADWVGFKCRYGCKDYGKHLSCPPYTPTPEETRRVVAGYEIGLLLRFDGDPAPPDLGPDDFRAFFRETIVRVNGAVRALEKIALFDGYYKAFSFGICPCLLCDTCISEERGDPLDGGTAKRFCRHPDLMRPSMEAVGMDVFATARSVGWPLSTMPGRDAAPGEIVSVALLLIA